MFTRRTLSTIRERPPRAQLALRRAFQAGLRAVKRARHDAPSASAPPLSSSGSSIATTGVPPAVRKELVETSRHFAKVAQC